MIEKLELKHIAPYLPYKLNYEDENGEPQEIIALPEMNHVEYYCDKTDYGRQDHIEGIKPLLRPMSDLFENIVHNGEIVCVAKLICDKHSELELTEDENGLYIWSHEADELLDFTEPQDLPYWIIQILNEYHFDWRYNLIAQGLAEAIKNK